MNAQDAAWVELSEFLKSHACQWSKQPNEGEWGIHHLDDPPHNKLLGPVFERGDVCGLVAIDGKILWQHGDIHRPDMTFSVTKTYLALVMGVACDRGLITDIDQTVSECLLAHGLANTGFGDAQNNRITWRHFLQFTSEWQGECFGIPDQIDHYRVVGSQPDHPGHRKGDARALSEPGTYWEYNDIRINQFAYALLRILKRPLPDVFAEAIMQPLGASTQWRWHGYDNSWVTLDDGQRLQSVPGGGHWGGGMMISAHDQFLVAQLMLDQGRCNGRQLLPAHWIKQTCTPATIAPWYGFFTWLNTNHAMSRAASEDSYFALGIGGQLIWHNPSKKLVAVLRWIDTAHQEKIIEQIDALT